MGIFSNINIFKNRKERAKTLKQVKMLNGNMPIFTQFGTDIYASDVVQQAVYTIVTEMKKLNPRHVRKTAFDMEPVEGNIQATLEFPNDLMTCSDFIEKITWLTILNYNCFIYIMKDRSGRVTELWPVNPTNVSFLSNQSGRLYVEMLFKNGSKYTLPYDSFIHIKTHYSVNDLMGGDETGNANNRAILSTLELNHTLLEGVKKALNSSFSINGIIKYNTMLDDGKIEKAIEDFEEKVKSSESGFLPIDLKSEIVPLDRKVELVDNDTLKFIDSKILRNFGVPLAILEGDYTTEQYAAFYQRTLEPLIRTYSEAFTKALFSDREKRGFANRIMFFPSELVFMNIDQTLQMVHELGQSGTLFENEKRIAFGLQPSAELVGLRLQSLNYVDVSIVKDYQMGNAGLSSMLTDGQALPKVEDVKTDESEDDESEEVEAEEDDDEKKKKPEGGDGE